VLRIAGGAKGGSFFVRAALVPAGAVCRTRGGICAMRMAISSRRSPSTVPAVPIPVLLLCLTAAMLRAV
jgi:hypothetical protein